MQFLTRSLVKVQPYKRGEITVFLALTFLVLVSFLMGVMDAGSLQMTKSYRRADMNRSIESVFAEYQKELFEEYDIFAIEGSYEGGSFSEDLVKKRLEYFGAAGIQQEFQSLTFLTDYNGREFVKQAQIYALAKHGMDSLQDFLINEETWRKKSEEGEVIQNENRNTFEQYREEWSNSKNPLINFSNIIPGNLANLIFPKDKVLSDKTVCPEELVSNRQLRVGYGNPVNSKSLKSFGKPAFCEYLMDHFDSATADNSQAALEYELEYLIAGKYSDRENIEEIIKKLIGIRFASNYAYLQTDSVKQAEAEALGVSIMALLGVSDVTGTSKDMVLLLWSFGESVMDVRSLLRGYRIPLIKTAECWQLDLQSLTRLGTEEDHLEGNDMQDGPDYEGYLKMLVFLTGEEKLAMRGMDLVELSLRYEQQFTWFYLDQCITSMKVKSTCKLRRGVEYDFITAFAYH